MGREEVLRPRKSPAQQRSRETVDAMVGAAAQVFERYGYAAGTTNRIAERAGVSIGSLYQYFPNKDAILVELVRRHIADGIEVVGPVLRDLAESHPPVREGLERAVAVMVELHRANPGLHRVLFEESPRPAELAATFDTLSDESARLVARWLADCPDTTVDDPAVAADIVIQVVEAVTHGPVIHPKDGREPEIYATEAVRMLEAYLVAQH